MKNLPGALATIWTKRYPPREARRKSLIQSIEQSAKSIMPDLQRIESLESEIESLQEKVQPTLRRISRLEEMASRDSRASLCDRLDEIQDTNHLMLAFKREGDRMSEQITVAQLIACLQEMPADAKVRVPYSETNGQEPCGGAMLNEDGTVSVFAW